MYIQSKIETRYQTPHPYLELVSVIYYRANVTRDEVLVLAAWVYPEYATPETIDLCVNRSKAGNWKLLELITDDARKKVSQISKGAPKKRTKSTKERQKSVPNQQRSAYYQYTP